MRTFIAIVILMSAYAVMPDACAQDMNTELTWEVLSGERKNSGDRYDSRSTLVTKNDKIVWTQQGGNLVYEFSIVSSTGTWTDVQEPGEMRYTVTKDGKTGEITFKRSGGDITVAIDFSAGGEHMINHVFFVHEVKPRD